MPRDQRTDKPVIGLLGGIGAGKSTVAAEFVSLGCRSIDADAIGHELLEDSRIKDKLAARWGRGIFDGQDNIDRKALAKAAFSSGPDTQALNAIMHPHIRRRISERIEDIRAEKDVPAIVVDAALLMETDWHELCAHFVFVSAPDDLRAERVRLSRGWNRATWETREFLQKHLDIKSDMADYMVDNGLNAPSLREQVRSILRQILRVADHP